MFINDSDSLEAYSFIVKDSKLKNIYGYCKHYGSQKAMMILTYLPWHDKFYRFIQTLKDIKHQHSIEFFQFLSNTYEINLSKYENHVMLIYGNGRKVQVIYSLMI